MKNFTKLLMAVVLLASYSCVQDSTEDLAPTISGPTSGSGELKTLQVSLPVSSRTELGEKVDGKYPVAWCEGDVLAVNGKPTTDIRISEEAANVAVFELPLGITIPYNIVYPYPGEDVIVGSDAATSPVVFASEQKYTEGTFAPNSAPMYAWSNGFDDVHMEHLATALRFSIKAKAGETVNLQYVSVATIGAEPISGVFDVYCKEADGVAAGTLKARKGAISNVFYTFEGNNFVLTDSNESVFYIAVPKGEYSGFEVSFVSNDGMVHIETFEASGDKQLLGGKVREFPTIEFESGNKMLLIGTDVDMELFANEVKAGTFNDNYPGGALLISNIDMTDKPWTSVEGFTSLFEGRNYTIKGLTTPLFGENLVGKISNVRVEGNLVETTYGKVGLIARSLSVDGDKVGTIFNCSAKGSIEYKNENISVNENYDLINVGGIVGGVYGGSVSLSESDVDVTISTAAGADGADKVYTPCIGGVVGYACALGENQPVVVENTNNGVVVWDDNSASAKVTPFIGGVAGYVVAGTFSDNINVGELYINEAMYDLDWGGVIGASAVSVVRCENKGSLSINETVARANIGGVLGKLSAESIVDCENSGKLLLNENFLINQTCNIGGVVAYADKGSKDVSNCLNSGSITYLGSCQYASRTTIKGNANIVLGGVVGFCWSESVKNCRNLESAVINVAGKVAGNGDIKNNKADSIDKMTAIAGVIGTRAGKQSVLGSPNAVTTENCSNFGNVSFTWQYCGASYIFNSACIGVFDSDRVVSCKNEGSVLVQANVSTDTVAHDTTSTLVVFISGMFGCINSTCDEILDCENAGSVTVDNSSSRMMWVSGLLGTAISGVNIKFTRCGNTGNIVVGENVNIRNVYVGGILANTLDIKLQYPNCFNSGRVESKATATAETYIGSIFGLSTGSDTGAGTEGIENTGSVTYSGNSALAYVGGYCGQYKEGKHTVQFTNASTGVVEFNGKASHIAFVGGVAGLGGSVTTNSLTQTQGVVTEIKSINANAGGQFEKGMTNNGNVKIMGYAPTVYISGGFGYIATSSNGTGGVTNNGVVEVPENPAATDYPTSIYMGGVFGYAKMNAGYPTSPGANTKYAINDCHNYGNILYNGMALDGAYIGGLVGAATKSPIINCSNNGDVISKGHAGNASPKDKEAEDKWVYDKTDVTNKGWAFNYKNHDIAIGGLVGETDLDIVNSENIGAVSHECIINPLKVDHNGDKSTSRFDVGGIAGRTFVPYSVHGSNYSILLSGLTNNGAVTIFGTPSATNNTPSIDLGDGGVWQWSDIDDADRTNLRLFYRVNSGGLFGRLMDNSSAHVKHYLNNCTNNAPVSTPNAAGAKCYSTAGVVGELLVSHAEFNNVKNTGKVSIEKAGVGTVIDGAKYIDAYFINLGGLVGTYFDSRVFELKGNYIGSVTFNDCQNDGDIYYGEIAASIYQCAGGILGQTLYYIRDACQLNPNASVLLGESYPDPGATYGCADVKFYRCKNNGNINYRSTAMDLSQGYNYNYAGGILGSGSIGHGSVKGTFSSVDLLFDHCENTGEVQFDRNNTMISTNANPAYTVVGGILGHFCGGVGHATSAISHSYSGKGTITTSNCYNAQIISCKNSGRIWGYSGYLGGIAGTCNWFVKITGTEDDPTINTGDIVVLRENGKVVTKNRYGTKFIYAGGIAGCMTEYTNAIYAVGNKDGNPAYPGYKPEDQYVRIEYAVNEGAVGSTGYAGGIAGYYYSAVQASQEINNATSRGGLEFCRNTGDIYALEGATTNIGAIVGMPRIANDANIYTSHAGNTTASALSEGTWQIGVKNCYVGGTLLRGAIGEIKISESNYMQAIYGVSWDDSYTSVVNGKPFDGCTFYVPAKEETPGEDNGGENVE